jgi:hypothetical protein
MKWSFFEAVRWDLPAIMLAVLLIGFAASLWLVQKRSDFDLAQIYLDEQSRVSSVRVLAVGTWVVATWIVMQDMLDGLPTPELFYAYVGTFSAAMVLEKAADKWDGSLPFGKRAA